MALNFSHRPLFPAYISEEKLVSPMRIANGYTFEEKKVDDCFDYGRDCRSGVQEPSMHKDILDLLPSDPFGMDISTTFTAITGWLEDLEVDYAGYSGGSVGTGDGNYSLFAGLNFIWSNAMRFQAFPGHTVFEHKENVLRDADVFLVAGEGGYASGDDAIGSVFNTGVRGSDNIDDDSSAIMDHKSGECSEDYEGHSNEVIGASNSAFSFAFAYLNVRDLLVLESVCRSLRSLVQNDNFLWRSIHIDQPLNEKITDDALLGLTNRARGDLQCLSLVECPRITNNGLKHVLESNPMLTKLGVPGCTKLSIGGIISSLKSLKDMGAQGVKQLRIGGLYGVTQKHFDELKFLLGVNSEMQQNAHKPHFYNREIFYLSCEDDRAIDIEMCPICENLRLIYDCPSEKCQRKEHPTKVCRGCTLCIPRCVQCGQCLNDGEYEETFSLDLLCSDCSKLPMKCQEKQEMDTSPSKSFALHEASCSLPRQG